MDGRVPDNSRGLCPWPLALRRSGLQTPSQPLELFPSKLKVFGGQEVSSSQASVEDAFSHGLGKAASTKAHPTISSHITLKVEQVPGRRPMMQPRRTWAGATQAPSPYHPPEISTHPETTSQMRSLPTRAVEMDPFAALS